MILLADESVDLRIVKNLRQDGHEVSYVAEMEPGLTDEAVLARANEKNALLLTSDMDFGELVFREGKLAGGGVVLLRLVGLSPERKAEVTLTAFRERGKDFALGFSVVSQGDNQNSQGKPRGEA
jgi:predicted nuclease of predicted toxin-antitoxin system